MAIADRMNMVAATDATFALKDGVWVGKCLICNGPVAFDARTGEGATLEHILARSRGGTGDLLNLGIVHAACNWEKGVHWDRKGRKTSEDYDRLVARFLERRRERFREP